MTNTFPSEIAYNEWKKRQDDFFLKDKRIKILLKQYGMTKFATYKTDDIEPVKAITIFEYDKKDSFQKCQKIFLKFMPKINDLVIKSNIVRGEITMDEI
tara:strand:+ start:209 stop:505 length:297 start_codon:yes stop_codon:yes gene_type:complete